MRYPRPPFNIAEEVIKIRKYTNLPVTDIVFRQQGAEYVMDTIDDPDPTETAELYINGQLIGTIDYLIFPGIIGTNDPLDNINWAKVYQICEADIFALIKLQEPRARTAKLISKRKLSVYDPEGIELTHVYYGYHNDAWEINVLGLNYVERSSSVQVTLTPPPPKRS